MVIVNPDQLSLAIGKHGQNVRLASKLTGWDLDIRAKEILLPKEQAKEEVVVQKEEEPEAQVMSLDELSGVGEKTKAALIEHGLTDVQAVASSTLEALVEVKGIGKAKAKNSLKKPKVIKNL